MKKIFICIFFVILSIIGWKIVQKKQIQDTSLKYTPISTVPGRIEGTRQIIDTLRTKGISEEKELKLEFFFYTKIKENAQRLAQELGNLGYEVTYRVSATNKDEYVVTGWTTKMKMDNKTVEAWDNSMVEMGYKYSAEYDGWGTLIDQE